MRLIKIFFWCIFGGMVYSVGREWSEDELQMYVVMMARRNGWIVHADGNGNYVNGRTAARKKLLGSMAGWPDLCFWSPRHVYVELKTAKGKQSAIQLEIAKLCPVPYYLVKAANGNDAWDLVQGIMNVGDNE